MRLVVASVAMVLGVAMLLPAATAPMAFAQNESASPYNIETVAYLGSTGRRDLFEQLVEDVSR